MNKDLINIIGSYDADTVKEIHYRVLERLGILYDDKPVAQRQIAEVVKQVEKDLAVDNTELF